MTQQEKQLLLRDLCGRLPYGVRYKGDGGWHPDFQPIMCNIANEQNMFDWLNKKGFDYRGLIPMRLALEAPEGMYKQ